MKINQAMTEVSIKGFYHLIKNDQMRAEQLANLEQEIQELKSQPRLSKKELKRNLVQSIEEYYDFVESKKNEPVWDQLYVEMQKLQQEAFEKIERREKRKGRARVEVKKENVEKEQNPQP